MRIVVVGASGNVGTSVLGALAEEAEVESILGIARRRPNLQSPKTSWVAADIARANLTPHLKGADALIHLAWLIQPSHRESVMYEANVDGSARVFEAVAPAEVPSLIYASSVGAYAPGPKDHAVDESWPTTGIGTSYYSRHKAAVERILDSFEASHPEIRVVRLRPGLIFKREAASEIRRYFAGPLLPPGLLRRALIPVVPRHPRLRFQAVHADDVAEAYARAALGDVRGAFNAAAEPVLDGDELARLLGARAVPVPARALRSSAPRARRHLARSTACPSTRPCIARARGGTVAPDGALGPQGARSRSPSPGGASVRRRRAAHGRDPAALGRAPARARDPRANLARRDRWRDRERSGRQHAPGRARIRGPLRTAGKARGSSTWRRPRAALPRPLAGAGPPQSAPLTAPGRRPSRPR